MTEKTPSEKYRDFKRRRAHQKTLVGQYEQRLEFQLDPFQIRSCEAVEDDRPVLVAAPTGAGKTIVGEFAIYKALAQGKRSFYTTPIKALSNQKYNDFCASFGSENVGLLTGDNVINGNAQIVVMTTEVLRNMLYQEDRELGELGVVVLDEVHYLADRLRGPVWEEVILHTPSGVQVVAISATVSNAEEFGAWIAEARGDCYVEVSEERPVPLYQHMLVKDQLFDLYGAKKGRANPALMRAVELNYQRRLPSANKIVDNLAREGLTPAIVFVFSRQGCDSCISELLRSKTVLIGKETRQRVLQIVDEVECKIPASDHYAVGLDKWRAAFLCGYAAHHAGMLPVLKEAVERAFREGLLQVVFATETLALGINMPAKTVVVTSLRKWNGTENVQLTPGEYTQLTGRAGRRGMDRVGHAVVPYRVGNEPAIVASLASNRTYPLNSAFRPTYSMVVSLLMRMDGNAARLVMEKSFAQFQADRKARAAAESAAFWRAEAKKHAVSCSRGDFSEYLKIRDKLNQYEKKGSPVQARHIHRQRDHRGTRPR
ncbi:MAG: DEAD/DEAH box helicase [Actinomycetaceae bacterium]|nr:DEAD/DEAH box helicase [Actinomycetaceae bacterium]